MRKEDEGNGYASALVAIIKILAAAVGSATLVVVSNHHPYWRRPSLGFSPLDAPHPTVFVPWSDGIILLHCKLSPDTWRDVGEASGALGMKREMKRRQLKPFASAPNLLEGLAASSSSRPRPLQARRSMPTLFDAGVDEIARP